MNVPRPWHHVRGRVAHPNRKHGPANLFRFAVVPADEGRQPHAGLHRDADTLWRAETIHLLARAEEPLVRGIDELAAPEVHHAEVVDILAAQLLSGGIAKLHVVGVEPSLDRPG